MSKICSLSLIHHISRQSVFLVSGGCHTSKCMHLSEFIFFFFKDGGQFYSLIKYNLTKAKPKKNWLKSYFKSPCYTYLGSLDKRQVFFNVFRRVKPIDISSIMCCTSCTYVPHRIATKAFKRTQFLMITYTTKK